MADRRSPQRQTRREPTFDSHGDFDLRLTSEDRAVASGPRGSRGKARREDLADEPQERRRPSRSGGSGGGGRGRRRKPRRSFLGRLAYWGLVLGLWCAVGIGGLVAYHASKLPPIDQLAVPKRPPNIAIVAADGSLLANRGDTGGRAVTFGELPKYLPDAFIAIEDRRFRYHFGVDPIGVARAVVQNLMHRGVSQGGSTLTQQLAKNLFLTQERTASRKIQEAILSIWLERNFTKDQILELYLNRVYFGSGAYGIEAAAQRYFGKPARAVTLAEAATLAGLVQAPSRLAPNRNPEASQARAQLVLAAMADGGFATADAVKAAMSQPAQAVRVAGAGSINYAADYVMDVIDDLVGAVETDIVVTTTIDPKMQTEGEEALVAELNAKGARYGVGQGALVSMTTEGAVRAVIGGRNYAESQFNRATAAKRQPGSSFKPFVYLTALEKGLGPNTVREDGPVSIKGWKPENFSRTYRGPVTLRDALATSVNTVAVKLAVEVGPRAVAQTAQRLGINSALQPNASIALGTSEVTPLELVSAYAAFANGGVGVVPHVVESVKTTAGKALFTYKAKSLGSVIDPAIDVQMNMMLHETMVTGSGRKADFPGWESAGKSGTSQEFRDAWFVGFTSHLVTGVWIGNDDSSPTKRVSGSTLPLEIWSRYMKTVHKNWPPTPLIGGPFTREREVPVAQAAPSPRGPVPGQRPAGETESAWIPPPPSQKGLLERLFGG